jgi:hypothetical protein
MKIDSVWACRVIPLIIVIMILNVASGPAKADEQCIPVRAEGPVSSVYKLTQPNAVSAPVTSMFRDVVLGDRVAIEVTGLSKLLAEAKCRNKGIVAFLNGQPVKGLTLFGPGGSNSNILYFNLQRTSDASSVWTQILGSPNFEPRRVGVTVGVDGEVALPALGDTTVLNLTVISVPLLLLVTIGFIALVIAFLVLARSTNILRDPTSTTNAVAVVNNRLDPTKPVSNYTTYSLARFQGAWWFFIILAAYLLIGITTWDFFSSVSSTAVILLGIGAGTVVGGAIIDASRDITDQEKKDEAKAEELKHRIEQLAAVPDALKYIDLMAKQLRGPPIQDAERQALASLSERYGPDMLKWLRGLLEGRFASSADRIELAQLGANARRTEPDEKRYQELGEKYPNLRDDLSDVTKWTPSPLGIPAEQRAAISQYRKSTNQSEWWFIDILSDANGVSFHRFQLAAWTLILGVVFAASAYRDLTMPVFDATLMGLLGLSAATYLGLKIPEPTVPK